MVTRSWGNMCQIGSVETMIVKNARVQQAVPAICSLIVGLIGLVEALVASFTTHTLSTMLFGAAIAALGLIGFYILHSPSAQSRWTILLPIVLGLLILLKFRLSPNEIFTRFSIMIYPLMAILLYPRRGLSLVAFIYLLFACAAFLIPGWAASPGEVPFVALLTLLVEGVFVFLAVDLAYVLKPRHRVGALELFPTDAATLKIFKSILYQVNSALSLVNRAIAQQQQVAPLQEHEAHAANGVSDDLQRAASLLSELSENLLFAASKSDKEAQLSYFYLTEHIESRVKLALLSQNLQVQVHYSFDPSISAYVRGNTLELNNQIEHIIVDTLYDLLLKEHTLYVSTLFLGTSNKDEFLARVVFAAGQGEVLAPPAAATGTKKTQTSEEDAFHKITVQRTQYGITVAFNLTLEAPRKGMTLQGGDPSVALVPREFTVGNPMATRLRMAHVLLVEDNAINQRVMQHTLQPQVGQLDLANDGLEAVAMAKSTNYDLILMDLRLPNLSGMDAARRIRNQEARTNTRVPIIALTAYEQKGDKNQCLRIGMDAFLAKPFQNDTLLQLMESLLAKQGSSRATSSPVA